LKDNFEVQVIHLGHRKNNNSASALYWAYICPNFSKFSILAATPTPFASPPS
jgi:hypothetical protein